MSRINSLDTIFKNLRSNIRQNLKLSFATIFVISVSLLVAMSFIFGSFVLKQSVEFFKNQSDIIIFFKTDTPEDEILLLKQKLEGSGLVERVDYVSQEDAKQEYIDAYVKIANLSPDTIDAKDMPANLEVLPVNVGDTSRIVEIIEQENNTYIDEILHFNYIATFLAEISVIVDVVMLVTIVVSVLIMLSLVSISIGFNIQIHKDEIEVMKLIGTDRSIIKVPFILEGALYGFIGSFIAGGIMIGFWTAVSRAVLMSIFSDVAKLYLGEMNLDMF